MRGNLTPQIQGDKWRPGGRPGLSAGSRGRVHDGEGEQRRVVERDPDRGETGGRRRRLAGSGVAGETGWAPPLICRRIRCPAGKRCAVEPIGTVTAAGSSRGRRRRSPSQTLVERLRGSTSQSRANTSAWPVPVLMRSSALTGPRMSTGAVSGAVVKVSTSDRASSGRLSVCAALPPTGAPPSDGVGSVGS